MNQSIQAARALAALLVVVMHTLNVAAAGIALPFVEATASMMRNVGHFGVDIFFVVSGYIIATVIRRERSPAAFLVRRAARVYPLFWLTLMVLLLVPPLPGAVSIIDPAKLPFALLLLSPTPAHPVAWTLVFEMHFYIVAAACLLFGQHAARALLIWCGLQTGVVIAAAATALYPYPFFTPLSLEFCFGVFLAFVPKKVALPNPLFWGAGALVLAVLGGHYFGERTIAFDQSVRLVFWGLPAAMVVWSALAYDAVRERSHPLMARIGDASYSLYMWHIAVLAVASWFLTRRIETNGELALYLGIVVVGCTLASWLSWQYFERPINRFFKSVQTGAKTASASAPIAASSASASGSSA